MIEIIATTIEDALEIEAGGANRIELVSALTEGGLTPSYGLIKSVIHAVSIPVNVIIRPHSKSFTYTDREIKLMKEDIEIAKALGANGVVLGVLTEDKRVDVDKLEDLLSVCSGLDVTFHRAIDETDVIESVRVLAGYDAITSILSSGGQALAVGENTAKLKDMIVSAEKIEILIGGGVNFDNIKQILAQTQVKQLHLGMAVRANDVVDSQKVREIVEIFNT